MYVVLEYLLLENFIINLLILYLNKMFLKIDVKNKKLILGSIVASSYSLVFFYHSTFIFTKPIFKLLFSMLIIRISFPYYNLKVFLKELFGFYIISFIFAGATLGAYYTSDNFGSILNRKIDIFGGFPVLYLILGITASVLISRITFTYFNQRSIKSNYIADAIIKYNDRQIIIKVLLDTGHSLTNPFTGDKVMVVEYEKLQNILPESVKELIIAYEKSDYNNMELILKKLQDEIKLNMIPFNSIGKHGILFAFKPDSVKVYHMYKDINRDDILVGIYSGSLSKEMGYSGLLHFELIDGGVENGYIEVQN